MSDKEYTYAQEIVPRLWLGNKHAALDEAFLKSAGINTVFNCTKDFPFSPIVNHKYRVPVDDNLEAEEINNMEAWAPEIAYKILGEHKRGSHILVHCHAGMQRSAAAVAIALIAETAQPADKVMAYIRQKRPVAFFPAANFDKAIRGFERRLANEMKRS